MHRCNRIPKISIQPAPSHHRSPTLSHTVRRHGVGPITVSRKSVPSPAHANMCASIGVTGYPRSGKLPAPLCHRSPTPMQAVRGGRLTPAPLLDARKSVPSTAHANMHTSIGVTGYPRSGKLPAPSRHRSPALSQTVRGHGDAAPTRRIALSRSARLGTSPILKSDYRRRSSTPCVRLRGCLRACVYV